MDEQQNFTHQVAVRCSAELKKSLDELAAKDYRPLGQYIRLILEKHVQEQNETAKEPQAA